MKNIEEKLDALKKEMIETLSCDYNDEKRRVLEYCPKFLQDIAKDYHVIIAGGMITSIFCNREVSDIDLYLVNNNDVFPFVSELLGNSSVISVTDKSILCRIGAVKVNVVLFREFKDANDIFESFDYTVCMGAYDLTLGEFFLHKNFLKHNTQRVLIFNDKTDYPLVSLLRIKKYEKKGYVISKSEFIRVALSCIGLELKSYKDVECHIGGMYGVNLCDIIDTSDEFSLKSVISKLSKPQKNIDEAKEFIWHCSDGDKLIQNILKKYVPTNVKVFNDYIVYPSGRISSLSSFMSTEGLEQYDGDFLLYKYVEKTDKPNVFRSFYKKDFIYTIGEYVEDEKHGIHCGPISSRSSFTYSDKPQKVLIELKVLAKDVLKMTEQYEQTTVKRALVVRAMKEDYINDDTEEIEY